MTTFFKQEEDKLHKLQNKFSHFYFWFNRQIAKFDIFWRKWKHGILRPWDLNLHYVELIARKFSSNIVTIILIIFYLWSHSNRTLDTSRRIILRFILCRVLVEQLGHNWVSFVNRSNVITRLVNKNEHNNFS